VTTPRWDRRLTLPALSGSQPRGESALMLKAVLVAGSAHRVRTQGTVHGRYGRARWRGHALGALLVLPACSAQRGSEPVSVTTPYAEVTPTAVPSNEQPSAPATGKPARNDLKKGASLAHCRQARCGSPSNIRHKTVSNNGLRVWPNLQRRRWQHMINKNNRQFSQARQRIYLSRVT
jgi:hypothetical protein